MSAVSTKGIYGLTAMYILAEEENRGILQIKEIASKGDIPQNYLEQLLVVLRKNGLVESVRGANGGYKLAKRSNEITVYEILNTLEGDLFQGALKTKNNILTPFWEECEERVKEFFLLTLSDLQVFLQKKSQNITYHI